MTLMSVEKNIAILDQLISALPRDDRARFHRIFRLSTTVGQLNPPETMRQWIEGYFGSVEAVQSQRIVKITNLVTLEGSLFNELRASRPMEAKASSDLEETIMSNLGDPFCKPLEGTPADTFGRVRGKHSITASNIAKYDGFHGVMIFDEHNPLVFSPGEVGDYIDTALEWAHKAHDVDREARYFFFMWNCLWKSGASILHGHAQMTLSRELHYAKVEHLRRSALRYRETHGVNYFESSCHYCEGKSEVWLGKALGDRAKDVMVSTKSPPDMEGFQSADEMRKAIDDSLRNLGVDCLDFYHAWRVNNTEA